MEIVEGGWKDFFLSFPTSEDSWKQFHLWDLLPITFSTLTPAAFSFLFSFVERRVMNEWILIVNSSSSIDSVVYFEDFAIFCITLYTIIFCYQNLHLLRGYDLLLLILHPALSKMVVPKFPNGEYIYVDNYCLPSRKCH